MTGSELPGAVPVPHATRWTLREHGEPLSIVKLHAGATLHPWADGLPLTAVVWSAQETTVVCPTRSIPDELPGEVHGPFVAFSVVGQIDFGMPGVLAELLRPLAETQVSVLAYSTVETKWILVPVQQVAAARAGWTGAKHTVEDA